MRYFFLFTLNFIKCAFEEVATYFAESDLVELGSNKWITNDPGGFAIYSCNGYSFYGGSDLFIPSTILYKAFLDLKPHYQIQIDMEIWMLDWNDEKLVIELDKIVQVYQSHAVNQEFCSDNSNVYKNQYFSFQYPHSRKNSFLKIYQQTVTLNARWGLRIFVMNIDLCPPDCLFCNGPSDSSCIVWKTLKFYFLQCDLQTQDISEWGGGIVNANNEFGQCQGVNSRSFENKLIIPKSSKILIKFFQMFESEFVISINENQVNIQAQQGLVEVLIEQQIGYSINIKIRDPNNLPNWMIRDLEIYIVLAEILIEDEIIVFLKNLECQVFLGNNCLNCYDGWELQQNICVPICGDQIIQGLEECDDGNSIQYDGCYECKYQCIQFCKICQYGNCIACQDGYSFNNNNLCKQNCQEKILIPYYEKECDQNQLQWINPCIECFQIYLCEFGCINCYQKICYQCLPNFNLIEGICIEDDVDDENLDSSNQVDCSKYIPEYQVCEKIKDFVVIKQNPDQVCKFNTFECIQFNQPQLILTYQNITKNIQYIQIQFTQDVKSLTEISLSQTIDIQIFDIHKENYHWDIITIQDSSQNISNVELILKIEITQLVNIKPILSLNLNQQLFNSMEQSIPQQSFNITLNFPHYLNEKELDISDKIHDAIRITGYALISASGMYLMVGNFQTFFLILNMIQYLQYLRYINLQFPYNLEIYFNSLDLFQIKQLLNLSHLDLLTNNDQLNVQKQTFGKFNYYEQNADLISNLYCQILQFVAILIFSLLTQGIKKIIYNPNILPNYFNYMSDASLLFNEQCVFKFNQICYSGIKSMLNELQKLMTFEGIRQILFVNAWDLLFKAFLYSNYIELFYMRDLAQLTILIIILTSYLFILMNSKWVYVNSKNSLKNPQKFIQFQLINLIKQILQLYFLIFIHCSAVLQLGYLIVISLIYLKVIIEYRNVFDNHQIKTIVIVEGSVLFFIVSSFIYIEDFQTCIPPSYKIILGWVHIFVLSLGMFVESVIILNNTFRGIINNLQKQKGEKSNNSPFIV